MTNFKFYLDQGEIDYNVNDTQLGEKWWNKFKVKTIEDLESFSPASNCDLGMKTTEMLKKNSDKVIEGLDHLIWYLKGHGYPIDGEFDINNVQESLNRLHEHFPTNMKDLDNHEIKEALKEYNLVIHWLEAWHSFKEHDYNDVGVTKFSVYFKLRNDEKFEFEDEECTFTPNTIFGDVILGYPQTGKNFTEVLISEDWDVPKEQILLHSKWSANIQMNFFDQRPYTANVEKWIYEKYMQMGGKEFFGRDWDDPRLGKGWIKVAHTKKNQDREKILDIVNKSSKILGWEEC